MKYITKDEAGTLEVATAFARTIGPGSVVGLIGELGTGKTVFARGVARAHGIKEQITSPTFTLIHEYRIRKVRNSEFGTRNSFFRESITLYHMDLYRINSIQEARDIGVEECFYSGGICLVEWAEKLGELCPKDAISVKIRHLGDTHREIEIEKVEKP